MVFRHRMDVKQHEFVAGATFFFVIERARVPYILETMVFQAIALGRRTGLI
jgi:hypothetical protein